MGSVSQALTAGVPQLIRLCHTATRCRAVAERLANRRGLASAASGIEQRIQQHSEVATEPRAVWQA